MSAPAALSISGLTKRYGDFAAVRDLGFSVERGEIFGFLGPNGAGKTTTLRMVLGLIPPTAGRIEVLGSTDLAAGRDRIGFLPEERGLYRRMTPIQSVVFFAGLKGVPAAVARRRGLEMLAAQGLSEAANRPMKALSKGMAQKVQIVCALAHRPDLVILDEPFAGLDPAAQEDLERQVRGLAARGATVIFSTHVMAQAERVCDRVALLARGALAFQGTVEAARAVLPRRLKLEGALDPADVSALPGVRSVEADAPGRLVATLKDGASPQAALKAAFARDLDVTEFRVESGTLHDAFLALTSGGER